MSRRGARTEARGTAAQAHCLHKLAGAAGFQLKIARETLLNHCFGLYDEALFNSVLKLLPPLAPDEVDDENRDAFSLEFLLNAIAEDPLMLSSRRNGTFDHLPIDILLTQVIVECFQEYCGPGVVHPFEGRHFVQGCALNVFCDASNAAVRAGVATALSRLLSTELDAAIVSLVHEARYAHEITRPH